MSCYMLSVTKIGYAVVALVVSMAKTRHDTVLCPVAMVMLAFTIALRSVMTASASCSADESAAAKSTLATMLCYMVSTINIGDAVVAFVMALAIVVDAIAL
ncbi:hypothetical protein THASP1DRAFT_33884 [Thamnocephalis sphaerospora]|uniref:Uncharacterized protein n=1 Tax=Thamnocephalis sphaerospora TaxID=78915 RepID=A0A4P9XFL2_9FUNG|nr:hypothetical protein THASP1DRAFT_33884 [Thamnocephalis sphaerospora]|eukprot:RKP04362.1 hypothetical protein THASP1DRAFT_33884 [Thamnocephalis sphaerospora]